MTLLCNRRSRGFGYLDVIVVIGVLVLVVAFFIPVRRTGHDTGNRIKCASNLRQIGQGMLLYANENRGAYPRMRVDETAGVRFYTGSRDTNPFDGVNDPLPNDVTAAVYLLVRTQDMGTEVFTCPSANEKKFTPTEAMTNFSNFPGRQHLSYAFANPYPTNALVGMGYKWNHTLSPEFAVAADMGSGVDQTAISATSAASVTKKGNSPNHSLDGQNVLFGDGHVEFTNTPCFGVGKDNIYAPAASVGSATRPIADRSLPPGVVPQHANDSILLPTAKD